MKIGAVTTALACAGGGLVIDHATSASGAASTPSVASTALDHYLCTGDSGHGGCAPAKVAIPGGTTFGVNNPGDRLRCDSVRRGHGTAPASIAVTNEFSPAGTTPVSLTAGQLLATCSLLPAVQFGNTRAHVTPVALETFACSSVHYPTRTSLRFTSRFAVTVNDQLTIRVLDPTLVCSPSGPQPMVASTDSLVCFAARVVQPRRRFFGSTFGILCVPSSLGTDPPPASSNTTTTSANTSSTTSTTSGPVTGGTTTTTTTTKPPAPAPTTTTTTVAVTTTTATTTTTAPAPTTTTTRPTTGTQPCAGTLSGGVCIINS